MLSGSGYAGPTYDDVCRMIHVASKEHNNDRLKRLIDGGYEKSVLTFFEEAEERAKGYVDTSIFFLMKHNVIKDFFTGGTHELLYSKMYSLAESQDFT